MPVRYQILKIYKLAGREQLNDHEMILDPGEPLNDDKKRALFDSTAVNGLPIFSNDVDMVESKADIA